MSERWITTLEIIIGGLITSIPAFLLWRDNVRKAKLAADAQKDKEKLDFMSLPAQLKTAAADAADKVAAGYDKLVEDLQNRIDRMEIRQKACEAKQAEYETRQEEDRKTIQFLKNVIRKQNAEIIRLGGSNTYDINGADT